MALATACTNGGRGLLFFVFCTRSPLFDPILEGTRTIKNGSRFAAHGPRYAGRGILIIKIKLRGAGYN